MKGIQLVVVDTMTFAYLQGLGQLELLHRIATTTRKVAVTAGVVKQLERSGSLGPLVRSYCTRGEMLPLSPTYGDEISRSVGDVLRRKESGLVRRNRTDVELVEVARERLGAVLTCENGIHALAKVRHVPTIDLLGLFSWAIRLGLISAVQAERAVAPWFTKAAPGTGCPGDFRESIQQTANHRVMLPETLDALLAAPGGDEPV